MKFSMKSCRNMIRAHRRCLVKCIILLTLANFIMWILIKSKSQLTTAKWGERIKGDAVRQHHPSYHGDDDAGVKAAASNLRKANVLIHETNNFQGQQINGRNEKQDRHYTDTHRSTFFSKSVQQGVIVNPHNFSMLINEPRKCINGSGGRKPVFLLVLVTTAFNNFKLRKAVRETWGSVTNVDGKNIITLFLLGRTKNELNDSAVTKESSEFRDIIMENFVDSYKNLTLKVIMGLNWAMEFCSHANYIMKTDDDMFVSYENLVRYLRLSKTPFSRFVVGRTIHEAPIRNPNHKWYVPTSVYEGSMLPQFCSGSGYVMSGDVAPMVAMTSLYVPYLHLEDVFIGLCLERLGIQPRRHIQFNNANVKYSYCRYKTVFTAHLSRAFVKDIYKIWSDLNRPKSFHCNIPFWPGNDPIFV